MWRSSVRAENRPRDAGAGGWLVRLAGRVRALSGWRRYALAALLGAGAALALPPVHGILLLLPAFTGLLWLLDGGPSRRTVFLTGWWFGFAYFVAGLYWFANALLTEPERWGWLVPLAVPGVALVLAVFPGVAAVVARLLCARGAGRVLALAVAWAALEWLRGEVLTGFPWNPIGSAFALSGSLSQVGAVAGIHGLCLLAVAVFASPAVLADGWGTPARRALPLALSLAALALVWGAGELRLALAEAAEVPGVRLRLVQANVAQSHKWRRDLMEDHFARYLEMSGVSAAPLPTHVLWPETAAPFVLEGDPGRRRRLAAVAPEGGVVITGAPRVAVAPGEPTRVWNSLYAITETGEIAGTYDKFHLVPFGEYVPFRRLLPIGKITAGMTDFSAGPGPTTLALPGLPPVSPLICYEAIFPGEVLDRGRRPAWLLNLTNDAWFGTSSGPYQHFEAARMRAIEEGLPLVRVANTGISAIVDPYGRVLARLGLGERGVLDGGLPRALPGLTPYARFGDLSLLLLLAVGAAASLFLSRRSP